MKLPDAMREARGGEAVTRAVALSGDDILATTPTRTLVYHGEGLLSDESVEEFPHDAERLLMSQGRRKTTFTLEYMDRQRELTVPASVTGDVFDALLEGICTATGILDDDETVAGTFRFSELTVVVADHQIVKHVGSTVWDQDVEAFRYGALTDLSFEQLGGAVEVVLEVDGRPERIKVPEDRARRVEETIKSAVFEYFEVQTMADLRSFISPNDDDDEDERVGLDLSDSGLDPLGGSDTATAFDDPLADSGASPPANAETDRSEANEATDADRSADERDGEETAPTTAGRSSADTDSAGRPESTGEADRSALEAGADGDDPPVTREDVRAMIDRIEALTEAIDKQNRLLRKQHQALKQLATEVRDED
ncbi:MAG: DUF7115 domain-containing protein [Halococcoides sp.]